MDPLSLTASVLAITTACLKSAHILDGLRGKYKHAQITISALCSEATVISASLSQIQSLILQNPGAILTQLRSRSDVIATFDSALTGCAVVFAVLDEEIAALSVEGQDGGLSWAQRAKVVWKDGVMKELLQQLRGQSAAIGLLIQALQIESISGVRDLLHQNSILLDRVMRQTRSLRESHPKVIAPRSIFDSHREEIGSVAGTENTGLSDSTFLFDDLVVDSKVYRRVLAQARSQLLLKGENEESTETVMDSIVPPTVSGPEAFAHRLRTFYADPSKDPMLKYILTRDYKDKGLVEEVSEIRGWLRELQHLDERCDYLRKTYKSLHAGRQDLHARMISYLKRSESAVFEKKPVLEQEEALAEVEAAIDEFTLKLESAENSRRQLWQKILEHVAAALVLNPPQPRDLHEEGTPS